MFVISDGRGTEVCGRTWCGWGGCYHGTTNMGAFREEDKKREMVQWIAEPPSPLPHSALCMKTKLILFLFFENGQLMAISGGWNKFLPGPAISKSRFLLFILCWPKFDKSTSHADVPKCSPWLILNGFWKTFCGKEFTLPRCSVIFPTFHPFSKDTPPLQHRRWQ